MLPIWSVILIAAFCAVVPLVLAAAHHSDHLRDMRTKGMGQILALLEQALSKHQFLNFPAVSEQTEGSNRIGLWLKAALDPYGKKSTLSIAAEILDKEEIIAKISIDKDLTVTLEYGDRKVKYTNAEYSDRDSNWLTLECVQHIVEDAGQLMEQHKKRMSEEFPAAFSK